MNVKVWLGHTKKMTHEHSVFRLGKVKYVHELQNLYFALTGEELEF